jgi:DNA (cytosine-5)-methyltransferase 1
VVGQMAGLVEIESPPKGWGKEGAAVGSEGMVEWSTLDAQWFGVAQRRKRVFALADFGDWAGRPPILLEPQVLRGDSAPQRGGQETVADAATPSATERGCWWDGGQVSQTLDAVLHKGQMMPEKNRFPVVLVKPVGVTIHGTHPSVQTIASYDDVAQCLRARTPGNIDNSSTTIILTPDYRVFVKATSPHSATEAPRYEHTDVAACLNAWDEQHDPPKHIVVDSPMLVRKLTEIECERLQGFPDNHTLVPHRGKPAAASPRYKALGNSMCTNVMQWIGTSIDFAHYNF